MTQNPQTPARETENMTDLLAGRTNERQCLPPHGFVRLVDVMPRLVPEGETGDSAIVQAARVSYGKGTKTHREDRGLIRYLMRKRHTSPFEHVEAKFHMAMPLFVARQFIRHRTANVNEYSARYSELPERFYVPENSNVRGQDPNNKQGSSGQLSTDQVAVFRVMLQTETESAFRSYEHALNLGVSREMARTILPVNVYTEWYWKCDLHNLLHFLRLRMDSHAQWEIRQYAGAIAELLQPVFPRTMEAFDDYRQQSMQLSGADISVARRVASAPPNRKKMAFLEIVRDFRQHEDMSNSEVREIREKLVDLRILDPSDDNDANFDGE